MIRNSFERSVSQILPMDPVIKQREQWKNIPATVTVTTVNPAERAKGKKRKSFTITISLPEDYD
jgi:hypothetical protein